MRSTPADHRCFCAKRARDGCPQLSGPGLQPPYVADSRESQYPRTLRRHGYPRCSWQSLGVWQLQHPSNWRGPTLLPTLGNDIGLEPRRRTLPLRPRSDRHLRVKANDPRSAPPHQLVHPCLDHRVYLLITTADVLAVLSPIWHTAPRQAEVLRRRISQVMRWAVAQGYRPDDAAGSALTAVLPKRNSPTTHHQALHHSDVADALRRVRGSGVAMSTRLAIEFLALTAARTTEVRLATRSEIDHQGGVWTVPAERMKAGREHRVPLSSAAIRVLDNAYRHADGDLLFPGRSGKPTGHGVLAATFRRLDIGTVHGLRSSFRDWCSETGVPREVAEQALAHTVRGVEGAYARSDLFDLRQPIMEAWGKYIDTGLSR